MTHILFTILLLSAAAHGDWRSHVKNVVVLVQENRSFDHYCGDFNYNHHIDGLRHRKFCNPANVTDPKDKVIICAKPTQPNVESDDPNHGISGVNMQLYGTFHPDEEAIKDDKLHATMNGFLTVQTIAHHTKLTRAALAINYLSYRHIPVFASLAQNFVLFDRWFAAVPGPTNPNRAYLTSGTSHGHGENHVDYTKSAIPSRSIFQQLSEKNISWINYSNTSTFLPDSLFYNWTVTSGAGKTNVKPFVRFFADAKDGHLPQLTYINPGSIESIHPPSPVSGGETFIKNIYEALRHSPQWQDTLFILTFDEHGGFGDHVPPPVNVPAGDNLTYTEKAPDGKPITFDFTRLGVRVPTLLISPWVGRGVIETEAKGHEGAYTHTSILAFLARLWDLDILTPRVAYSPSFESLITDTFRANTPKKLPGPAVPRIFHGGIVGW
jgi:phospholipase C